jgi:membrane fusion protein, multidrug efflux system
VPANLAENFSSVRQVTGQLLQSAAQLGYAPPAWDVTYKQAKEAALKLVPEGNLEDLYAKLIPQAPPIKQLVLPFLSARPVE